jgi:phage baseplate assembly protein W
MAIKIKELEELNKTFTAQNYVYKDLSLDLVQTKIDSPGVTLPVPGSDVKASFDLAAITNSLTNLFNTLPGQRFLFPKFGLNLYPYVFEAVTVENGELIGETVLRAIETFEPRVRVLNVNVEVDIDNQQYYVAVILELPIFKTTVTQNFVFKIRQQSFIALPIQRKKTD